jgi:hypothetical protein
MNPIAPYLLGAYVLGWVICARVIYRYADNVRAGEDRLSVGFVSLLWPVLALVLAGRFVIRLPTMGAVTREQRMERDRVMRRRVADRDERIAELEREAGIRS